MARIIGVKDLYIAKLEKDELGGDPSWGKPVKVPSLISVSINDQKENVTFYSDDTIEQIIPAFSGKEVSIELGHIHPRIESMISGNTYSQGVYKQSSSAIAPEVAIMFRAPKSKAKNPAIKNPHRYVTLFKGILAREEEDYQGKQDTIESSNVTLNGLFMPLVCNKKVEFRTDNDVKYGEIALDPDADVDTAVEAKHKQMIADWFTEVQWKFPQ